MTIKRLPNSNPAVKRKVGLPVAKRLRRTIPDGATFTTTTLNKMSKRTRAGKKSPGYLLKREFKEWLRDYPGMSAAFWNVACAIVDLYNFRYGKAWPSTETIKEMSGAKSRRTVDRAIKFFHDEGIIFTKSGGYGSIRSNNYVPNLRLILNRNTGEIIRNCAYLTKTENWAVVSAQDPRGCHVPVRQNVGPKSGASKCRTGKSNNRQKYAIPVRQNVGLRSDSVVERAKNAAPTATPDGSANGTAAREKKGVVQVGTLLLYLDMTFEKLIELFDEKGSKADFESLDSFCKREMFKPSSILQEHLPNDVTVYGSVVVHGGKGMLYFDYSGPNNLVVKKKPGSNKKPLDPDSWLVIKYLVSPEHQAAKVQELQTGT